MKTALLLLSLAAALPALAAIPLNIQGPPGSGAFGSEAVVLPNGNFVITDPLFDRQFPAVTDAGAVFLYRPDGTLISRIIGSTAGDQLGYGGIVVLASGNFLVLSPEWDHGGVINAGAVTFGHADQGFEVTLLENVTPSNSLVGSTMNDYLGITRPVALSNGHYVVGSRYWDNGSIVDAGAVTWGNGREGVTGTISVANSLVGSSPVDSLGAVAVTPLFNGNYVMCAPNWDQGGTPNVGCVMLCQGTRPTTGSVGSANALVGSSADDKVGEHGIQPLPNGNFLVISYRWHNGSIPDAGAVTWVNGVTGLTGPVSVSNSLVGGSSNDWVGSGGVVRLKSSHYVVLSPYWDGLGTDQGAITWGNGFTGTVGVVSATNSMVGATTGDQAGSGGASPLPNGHYVVCSPYWDDGGIVNAGAVTWLDGSGPAIGNLSKANSLHGTSGNDLVGQRPATVLSNGHYVVTNPAWDNDTKANAGAVTWCDGNKGLTGPISNANSLVGGTEDDIIGSNILALMNGHYVVSSYSWDNGTAADAGAVTWCDGRKPVKGLVSPSNSLVGTRTGDWVGDTLIPLGNGNCVIHSQRWANGTTPNVGAVTWMNGNKGLKGTVSASNSLIGEVPGDLWSARVTFLSNGNYVVATPSWNNYRGAVTWCNGKTGLKGIISAANSLLGSVDDELGDKGVEPWGDGDYYFISEYVDNGVTSDAGAVTLCNGSTGTVGFLSPHNTVYGNVPNGGGDLNTAREGLPARGQLVITKPRENTVTLFGNHFPRSLAKTGQVAPGAADIAFSSLGSTAVTTVGGALFDSTLTGAGAKSGQNRAVFASPPYAAPTDLVLQTGDGIQGHDEGPPINGTASAMTQLLQVQPARGVFQVTLSGSGVTNSNNKLLMMDTGAYVVPVLRAGDPLMGFGPARIATFREVLQSEDSDLLVLSYGLALSSAAGVSGSNDTGLLPITHGGAFPTNAVIAREGATAFGGGGTFGQFSGRAAAGDEVIHFQASLKPASGSPKEGLFRFKKDGSSPSRVALVGETPPDVAGDPDAATVTFSSFPAFTHHVSTASEDTLFKAILKGGESGRNEGLWRLPHASAPGDTRIVRKGDQVTGLAAGIVFNRIERFWPASAEQIILQARISGPGVNASNNQVLALRQADGNFLVLLRTGDSPNGIGTARISALSAVEVDPVTGVYAVLTTLAGAPSNSNQALWIGGTLFGADTPASEQAYRLPHLRLRKGETFSSSQTESAVIKSLSLKPFLDASGAGNRGQSRCMSATGGIAVYLLIDRGVTELVVLPPLFTAI